MTRLYIIAGEPSGDRLGGTLMAALNQSTEVEFRGVGGQTMQAAGLASRFDMAELTVMGLTEVLPKLPALMRRIRQTADDVITWRPDALITIDSPDFTLRVARKVRETLPDLKVIYYVAPSVWAWRPGRAKKMARHVDHVLALLPFEPPYMEAAGMTCDFVGHPIVSQARPDAERIADFRQRHDLTPDQPVLLMAPGSRKGEIRRLMPDFGVAHGHLAAQIPDLAVLVPVAETVDKEVRAELATVAGKVVTVPASSGEAEKRLAFAAADAALCASGTVVLEIAAAGTPMVAAYRTTWLTAQIVRRIVKVRTANLVNLIAGTDVVPEFLQEYCTPRVLERELSKLLNDPSSAEDQRSAFDNVLQTLGRGGQPPAERAAASVLRAIGRQNS